MNGSAGLGEEIRRFESALGADLDQLRGGIAGLYASGNIIAGSYDVDIAVFESAFDVDDLSSAIDTSFSGDLEYLHVLAYAYQQVGRADDANTLLARLHESPTLPLG
jgi:tetratricopeptide (TPR) repeat protein